MCCGDLYQGLVPGTLHGKVWGSLFAGIRWWTFTMGKAQGGTWLGKRVFDPTSGSGAFLLATLQADPQRG